jgi:hypothetical protein
MSTEPYPPEVSGDESGIVPPQPSRSPDWPKKIRTLTAAELDRLTIDGSGRFYWDGKLVNYGLDHPKDSKSDSTERSAMEMLDRAAYELGDRKTPDPIEGAEIPRTSQVSRDQLQAVDLDMARQVELERSSLSGAQTAALLRAGETRLTLSRWQSIGAVILVIGIALGATGLAAYGWAVAHEWGCRSGMITNHCPTAPSGPSMRSRSDIPA